MRPPLEVGSHPTLSFQNGESSANQVDNATFIHASIIQRYVLHVCFYLVIYILYVIMSIARLIFTQKSWPGDPPTGSLPILKDMDVRTGSRLGCTITASKILYDFPIRFFGGLSLGIFPRYLSHLGENIPFFEPCFFWGRCSNCSLPTFNSCMLKAPKQPQSLPPPCNRASMAFCILPLVTQKNHVSLLEFFGAPV